MNCWISNSPVSHATRAGDNTAAACGLCRLICFLSCKDTDVAETLRSRCAAVIKRDLGDMSWQWYIGDGRMSDGRAVYRGTPPHMAVDRSCLQGVRTPQAFANS